MKQQHLTERGQENIPHNTRGRRHEHRHHDGSWQHDGPQQHGHRHGGGHGGRVRRGDVRYVLLDALREGPKHGYEIIKSLEQRSQGQYAPSPGTVYPTLQLLEDLGLVQADQGTQRRTFQLTEAGQTELLAHDAEVKAFWAQMEPPVLSNVTQSELGFLQAELDSLTDTIAIGIKQVPASVQAETVRQIRLTLEQCKAQVRQLVTDANGNNVQEAV